MREEQTFFRCLMHARVIKGCVQGGIFVLENIANYLLYEGHNEAICLLVFLKFLL